MQSTVTGATAALAAPYRFHQRENLHRVPATTLGAANSAPNRPQWAVRPEFAWTGSFGTTTTGLPYIGAIPRHPRIHAVMGYGGNGITFSQIASEIIPASIKGLADTDAELFAFNR